MTTINQLIQERDMAVLTARGLAETNAELVFLLEEARSAIDGLGESVQGSVQVLDLSYSGTINRLTSQRDTLLAALEKVVTHCLDDPSYRHVASDPDHFINKAIASVRGKAPCYPNK